MDGAVRVLLLEDDELFSETIAESLTPACSVACARSIDTARELLAAAEFDVLVSDFVLGHETSEAFLHEVAAQFPSVRRVLFSGAPPDIGASLAERGVVDCALRKPFDVVRLLAAIRG